MPQLRPQRGGENESEMTKESCFVAIDTRQPGIMARDAITAIHAPTDNPSIETAYLLGEPEEV